MLYLYTCSANSEKPRSHSGLVIEVVFRPLLRPTVPDEGEAYVDGYKAVIDIDISQFKCLLEQIRYKLRPGEAKPPSYHAA